MPRVSITQLCEESTAARVATCELCVWQVAPVSDRGTCSAPLPIADPPTGVRSLLHCAVPNGQCGQWERSCHAPRSPLAPYPMRERFLPRLSRVPPTRQVSSRSCITSSSLVLIKLILIINTHCALIHENVSVLSLLLIGAIALVIFWEPNAVQSFLIDFARARNALQSGKQKKSPIS